MALSTFTIVSFLSLVVLIVVATRLVFKKSPVSHIQGPPSPSWIVGHEDVLRHQEQLGDHEFSWFRAYGSVFRRKGVLYEDILMVADAKAIHHVLHASGYGFPKSPFMDLVNQNVFGNGVVTVKGMDHHRHRKVLLPAFSLSHLRTFANIFQRYAKNTTQRMNHLIERGNKTINIYGLLGQATLDILGESAFRYKFNALEEREDDELSYTLKHLFDDVLAETKLTQLLGWLWLRIPPVLQSLADISPSKQTLRFRNFQQVTKKKAREILAENGDGAGKDILSILVRANETEDSRRRLDEDEILSQASSIILAGHETSASTMTWMLYELSRRPDQQAKIRSEIAEARSKNGVLSPQDYDDMVYLNAVIKETLRLHPVVAVVLRASAEDDVIPLSEPITTTTGTKINQIPVGKGQLITVAIHYYNRNPSVWGDDAEEWKPERFLTPRRNREKDVTVGLLDNLLSFSAGVRSCIGWRFSIIEVQMFIVELLENFAFSFPEDGTEVLRQPAGPLMMLPAVKGKTGDGPQLPLCVTALP